MDAKPRFFLLALCAVAAGVLFFGCNRPRPLTSEDMAGIWRVDRGYAPNHANPPLPDGYYEATLTLNPDGSFIASNLPPDFFHTSEQTFKAAEYRGSWTVQWAGKAYSLRLKIPGNSEGYYSTLVEKRTGRYAISMNRDREGLAFYMTASPLSP